MDRISFYKFLRLGGSLKWGPLIEPMLMYPDLSRHLQKQLLQTFTI